MTLLPPSARAASKANVARHRSLNPKGDPHSPWLHIDPVAMLPGVLLSAISIAMIYSATRGRDFENYDTTLRDRQAMFVAAGIGLMILLSVIDYRALFNWVWGIYIGAMGLLVLVLVPGIGTTDPSGFVRSWFQVGAIGLQPSEPAKLALILALAWWISKRKDEMDVYTIGGAVVIAATPMLLIREQPDIGTMLVFGVIAFGMLLIGGAQLNHLMALGAAGITGAYLAIPSLTLFQRERLTAFIDPSVDANYNVAQAQIAIGNGGLTGTGFGQGTQTNSSFVPEQHTDFIFTVIGEELGFVGGAITIGLFAILTLRVYRIAMIAGDQFGSLIAGGVLAMFVFQIFQSIGMTMGIMPVTGIPLPFVSYGGSSTFTSFAAVGLVASVHMRRHQAKLEASV